ncbi:NEW3 domain-containing protein [Paenibacillus tarimensis]
MQKCRRAALWLMVCIGFWAATAGTGANTAYAAGEVELYTPYTQLSAPPGESLSYSIEVINRTNTTQKAELAVRTSATGWEYQLTAGGRSIRELAVKPNDSQTINLQLDVPLNVDKGDYRFDIAAGNLASLQLVVNVSEKGTYNSELTSDQPNMQGFSDSSFNYSAQLRNRTAEQQTYSLQADAGAGWDVRFKSGGNNVTSVTVEPNASQTVTIEATPPVNIEAGTYKIPVRASNQSTSAELELEAVVSGTYGISLSTANEVLSADITAGGERKLDLLVKNTGTIVLEDVSLNSQSPTGWEVTFEPKTIRSIEPGKTTQVQATLKADKRSLAGDYVVSMTASSAQKSSNASLRMSVKSSVLWGWIGILIILAVAAGLYGLFRKYGRR